MNKKNLLESFYRQEPKVCQTTCRDTHQPRSQQPSPCSSHTLTKDYSSPQLLLLCSGTCAILRQAALVLLCLVMESNLPSILHLHAFRNFQRLAHCQDNASRGICIVQQWFMKGHVITIPVHPWFVKGHVIAIPVHYNLWRDFPHLGNPIWCPGMTRLCESSAYLMGTLVWENLHTDQQKEYKIMGNSRYAFKPHPPQSPNSQPVL